MREALCSHDLVTSVIESNITSPVNNEDVVSNENQSAFDFDVEAETEHSQMSSLKMTASIFPCADKSDLIPDVSNHDSVSKNITSCHNTLINVQTDIGLAQFD